MFPKLLGTFAAQTLAERYDADPSAADWRRFGRLPGFTNCKPKYRKSNGLFPFVRLHGHSGKQYPMAEAFEQEITTLYEAASRDTRRDVSKVLFLPEGDRGYRTYLLSDSEAQPSTRTVPPPPTSLSVSPLLPMA
ncbi:MAG: traI protein helicase [Edaphobacter sp.]|nr:traI protein helicase [Edaphobacter sp.]